MNYFYSSGAMGYLGEGYLWHKLFNFPKLPLVTKTITRYPKRGNPWLVVPMGKSVYNRVALNNKGIEYWLKQVYNKDLSNITVSLAGTDDEIQYMVDMLETLEDLKSIELNFSCPNVADHRNKWLPLTTKKLYLKLNYTQSPYLYDVTRISGVRVNSIPVKLGGMSGKAAQKKNWAYIHHYISQGLNVAGCSFTSLDDIKRLKDMGCKEIGIGSTMLTNPKLIEKLMETIHGNTKT